MLLHQQLGGIAIISLLIAVIPLVVAVACAIRPTESKLALMRPLSLASLFGGLAGTTGGVFQVVNFLVVRNLPIVAGVAPAADSNATVILSAPYIAFAEALVPLFVCFGTLSLAWLLVAFGMRRHG